MKPATVGPDALFKVLAEDGASPYAGFQWPLPNGKPTKWVRAKGPLALCDNGIHLCREQDLLGWLVGPAMYVAEARGKRIDSNNKIVVREARLLYRVEAWNEKNARLFACDCAERALRRVTAKYGKQDRRSWAAIKAARRFANGEIDDAATSAATSAAESAARSAARSAATSAAWLTADSAARSAATSAARSAAWSAAWLTEREWQAQRLMQYIRGEAS